VASNPYSTLTWGAATTVSTLHTGVVPASITFSIGVTAALVAGDVISLYASQDVFAYPGTSTCTAPGVGTFTALSTSLSKLTLHIPSGGMVASLKLAPTVITCSGGLAANLASGTLTRFRADSSKSILTTADGADAGYTTTAASALTWGLQLK